MTHTHTLIYPFYQARPTSFTPTRTHTWSQLCNLNLFLMSQAENFFCLFLGSSKSNRRHCSCIKKSHVRNENNHKEKPNTQVKQHRPCAFAPAEGLISAMKEKRRFLFIFNNRNKALLFQAFRSQLSQFLLLHSDVTLTEKALGLRHSAETRANFIFTESQKQNKTFFHQEMIWVSSRRIWDILWRVQDFTHTRLFLEKPVSLQGIRQFVLLTKRQKTITYSFKWVK